MFSVYCEQCGSVLLLGPANIVAVQNSSDGIVVRFRCHAGHTGVWLAGPRPAPASTRHRITRAADARPGDASANHPTARAADPHRPLPHRLTLSRRWAMGERQALDRGLTRSAGRKRSRIRSRHDL